MRSPPEPSPQAAQGRSEPAALRPLFPILGIRAAPEGTAPRKLALLPAWPRTAGLTPGGLGCSGSADGLLKLRQGKGRSPKKKGKSGGKEAWRQPKKTMDHAYMEAMRLLEGDSTLLRQEQLQELHQRGASPILRRGMGLALGVVDLEREARRDATIGRGGKAMENTGLGTSW